MGSEPVLMIQLHWPEPSAANRIAAVKEIACTTYYGGDKRSEKFFVCFMK